MVEEYSDEKLDEICDRVYEWFVEFQKSQYYEKLTEEQKEESEFVIMSFAEFMYSYHGLPPEEWDEDGLEECCLDTLPRKVSAEGSYYKSISPVLSTFFDFLGERNLLKNAQRLIRRVKSIDEEIIKNAIDPKNWGIAKSFVMAAKKVGVDVTNEKEMEEFMAFYNLLILGSKEHGNLNPPVKYEKPKIGRNEPCPCGSGKKYKKCCGR
jgi:hypothetical protein